MAEGSKKIDFPNKKEAGLSLRIGEETAESLPPGKWLLVCWDSLKGGDR